jgi:uncharacterized delta-60 repeat protein
MPSLKMNAGGTVQLGVKVDQGYEFDSWSIIEGSGAFVNARSASTTFTAGTVDTTIKASFRIPAQSGSLDSGLDGDGVLIVNYDSSISSSDSITASDILPLADGGFYVLANYFSGQRYYLYLTRHNADGSPDMTFADKGIFKYRRYDGKMSYGDTAGYALSRQEDGKILVAGYCRATPSATKDSFMLLRLLPDGSLDASFGNGGIAVAAPSSSYDNHCQDMAIQADGKIVLTGRSNVPGGWGMGIARFSETGMFDPSFSQDGLAVFSPGSASFADACQVTATADGKLLIAGFVPVRQINYQDIDAICLLRLLPDGTLDTTFGNAGITLTNIKTCSVVVHGLALASDGSILTCGNYTQGSTEVGFIARHSASGALDTSFGNQGSVAMAIGTNGVDALACSVDTAGRIVVAGQAYSSWCDFVLFRFSPTGNADSAFGSNGSSFYDISSVSFDRPSCLAIDGNGLILVGGSEHGNDSVEHAAVIRVNP